MKLAQNIHNLKTVGITNQQQFSIKSSAQAFQILSDGLYSNKIKAIIRELSCNAYDSHVAAGKVDVPFSVHIPTKIEPWFAVQDFGIGLSHDDILTLYTTYFDSTKSDSNEFVGALGLGSKSPFSYCSQFIVESIYNKVKCSYVAYINEQGAPMISLVGEEDVDADNGLLVRCPVTDSTDQQTFIDECKNVFKWFDVKPETNITLDLQEDQLLFKGNKWKLYKDPDTSTWNSNVITCVQGNVAYDVTELKRTNTVCEGFFRYLNNTQCSCVIYGDIGDFEVTASRESLKYDDRTVNNIVQLITECTDVLNKQIIEMILGGLDDCETYWDACKYIHKRHVENHKLFTPIRKEQHRNCLTSVVDYDTDDRSSSMQFKTTHLYTDNLVDQKFKKYLNDNIITFDGRAIIGTDNNICRMYDHLEHLSGDKDIAWRVRFKRYSAHRGGWRDFILKTTNKQCYYQHTALGSTDTIVLVDKDCKTGAVQRIDDLYHQLENEIQNVGGVHKHPVMFIIPDKDFLNVVQDDLKGIPVYKLSDVPYTKKPSTRKTVKKYEQLVYHDDHYSVELVDSIDYDNGIFVSKHRNSYSINSYYTNNHTVTFATLQNYCNTCERFGALENKKVYILKRAQFEDDIRIRSIVTLGAHCQEYFRSHQFETLIADKLEYVKPAYRRHLWNDSSELKFFIEHRDKLCNKWSKIANDIVDGSDISSKEVSDYHTLRRNLTTLCNDMKIPETPTMKTFTRGTTYDDLDKVRQQYPLLEHFAEMRMYSYYGKKQTLENKLIDYIDMVDYCKANNV